MPKRKAEGDVGFAAEFEAPIAKKLLVEAPEAPGLLSP